jgi:hypothetical protein
MQSAPAKATGRHRLRFVVRAIGRRCPLDRGESDYFYGAYMLNFVAAELVAIGAFMIALLLTWPSPPWTVLTYGTVAIAVIAPIALYRTTKALWLALDLILRSSET